MNKKAYMTRIEEIIWIGVIVLVGLFAFKTLIGFNGIEKIPMDAVESVIKLNKNYQNCTTELQELSGKENIEYILATEERLKECKGRRLSTGTVAWMLLMFCACWVCIVLFIRWHYKDKIKKKDIEIEKLIKSIEKKK